MRVLFTSPWVPAELIRAHGLAACGVWFAEDLAFGPAPLAEGVCAFAQAVLRLTDQCPADAVIFTTHCDQLRRGFDAASGDGGAPRRQFLFNLPATWGTPAAERLFLSEVERLGHFLVELGGRPPSDQQLLAVAERHDQARRRLLQAAAHCPALAYAQAVARFHWDGSVCLPEPLAPCLSSPSCDRVPLALVGGPLPRAQWRLFELLEQAGGQVVLNATEAGERSLGSEQPSSHLPGGIPSPALRKLARAYLSNCVDVFQRPNSRLYAWLGERMAARGARGIVLWAWMGCDLWRAEAQSLREALGRPVLALDADEAAGGWPRLSGRIEAFLEALRA
jgi:hypothetical protein